MDKIKITHAWTHFYQQFNILHRLSSFSELFFKVKTDTMAFNIMCHFKNAKDKCCARTRFLYKGHQDIIVRNFADFGS